MTKALTSEQQYKRNQKRAKFIKRLAPICFWAMIGIAILSFVLAIRYSVGNVIEIIHMLNKKAFNGEQLQQNYNALIQKYGEFVIGNGGMGFQIRFVNVGNALFSKLMVFYLITGFITLGGAFVIGKWALPRVAREIDEKNQDLVNLTVLRNNEITHNDIEIQKE